MGSAPSGARRPTPPSAQLSKPAAATAGALSPQSAMLWQSPRPSQPQRDPVDRGEQLPDRNIIAPRGTARPQNDEFHGVPPLTSMAAARRKSNQPNEHWPSSI